MSKKTRKSYDKPTASQKKQKSNEKQAEMKAKISKAPLVPNREPFDQGTCI